MGATKPNWVKMNSWDKTVLYVATWRKHSVNVTVESAKDKIGPLKRVQSSITNDFECYGMNEVKKRINAALMEV